MLLDGRVLVLRVLMRPRHFVLLTLPVHGEDGLLPVLHLLGGEGHGSRGQQAPGGHRFVSIQWTPET